MLRIPIVPSQILRLELLPEHEVTDLVYQAEQATVLGLLRAGLNAVLSLTEPAETGGRAGSRAGSRAGLGGRWTGHVEGARRFTLDHFIALVETRAVNDILVVSSSIIFLPQSSGLPRAVNNCNIP